jgi:hypothetical protein
MRFTYHVPLAESAGVFRRPLDVPSEDVQVCVRGRSEGQVSCNLPRVMKSDQGVTFTSASKRLPESFTLELQIDALPLPWMQYARWAALFALAALAAATFVAHGLWSVRSQPGSKSPRQRDVSRRAA